MMMKQQLALPLSKSSWLLLIYSYSSWSPYLLTSLLAYLLSLGITILTETVCILLTDLILLDVANSIVVSRQVLTRQVGHLFLYLSSQVFIYIYLISHLFMTKRVNIQSCHHYPQNEMCVISFALRIYSGLNLDTQIDILCSTGAMQQFAGGNACNSHCLDRRA